MRVLSFTGSDAGLRRHALAQALPQGLHPLDIGWFDMALPAGRSGGAAAVARGPLVGDRRVVVWTNVDALSKLGPADPTWTLLLRVAAAPRTDVTLLAEGEAISIPVEGWAQLVARGTEQVFAAPAPFKPKEQEAMVRTVANQAGVALAEGAAEAVLEACGPESTRVRHLLERLALTATEPLTANVVRAAAAAEALSVFDLVKACLAQDKPRALRAAAAVAQGKQDMGLLLRTMQKQALEQLVISQTMQADKGVVAKVLGYRKSGVVYFRRQELPLFPAAEVVLAAAIAMAGEVTEGVRLTQRQAVQRCLIAAFGSA